MRGRGEVGALAGTGETYVRVGHVDALECVDERLGLGDVLLRLVVPLALHVEPCDLVALVLLVFCQRRPALREGEGVADADDAARGERREAVGREGARGERGQADS